jgi:2-polyprenyl-3-methyl-5-hydroxy-6-metoxy-1,4-benzoquinol methylase
MRVFSGRTPVGVLVQFFVPTKRGCAVPETVTQQLSNREEHEIAPSAQGHCRFCSAALRDVFVDLGLSPLANSYVSAERLSAGEMFFPLKVYICRECLLVQLEVFETPENIFSDYAYLSSYSDSWLEHARQYSEAVIERFRLDASSFVVEIASNDGYLLQNFTARKIPVLGIEPAANVAEVALGKGIPTLVRFFGSVAADEVARTHRPADLIVGNNVLAHVPQLNDFVAGLKKLLSAEGVITMEFPHLLRLMQGNQFDTIYHEHFSYFSFHAVRQVFAAHGLTIFDVEELPTHGGSLRIYARHREDLSKAQSARVGELEAREAAAGMHRLEGYSGFAARVIDTKAKLLSFLIEARRQGKRVAAYGAAAKGNTLLNYCGIRTDLIEYVVDRSHEKQGKYLPGTRIPIYDPGQVRERRPDFLLILPWNIKDEVMAQMDYVRSWGGKFVVPIPEVTVY